MDSQQTRNSLDHPIRSQLGSVWWLLWRTVIVWPVCGVVGLGMLATAALVTFLPFVFVVLWAGEERYVLATLAALFGLGELCLLRRFWGWLLEGIEWAVL